MSERPECDFGCRLYQITPYYGLFGRLLTLKMKMLLYLSKCLSVISPVTGPAYYHQSRMMWRGSFLQITQFLMIKIMWCSTQVRLYMGRSNTSRPDWNYVAVQLKKTSLTSNPNSSIERVIFSVARGRRRGVRWGSVNYPL